MYMRPAEWHQKKTIWLAWPFAKALWGDDLVGAQQEFINLVSALENENLNILVPNQDELEKAYKKMKAGPKVSFKQIKYGDIWLRDTFPVFVKDEKGKNAAVIPRFNGWGGKYLFEHDLDLSTRISDLMLVPKVFSSVIFEGGAIDCDGLGTLITTEQCLLNDNRNPGLCKSAIESDFNKNLGAKKIIWLKEGLKNDHTDGHVDNIARFVGPQLVAIMMPKTKDDPNYNMLNEVKNLLSKETDALGHRIKLLEIPSPKLVLDRDGKIMPASYLNFIIGDETVVVPQYGTPYDQEALNVLKSHFQKQVLGCTAKSILTGGGAFHCISQESFR